jgi:hypothetical protein
MIVYCTVGILYTVLPNADYCTVLYIRLKAVDMVLLILKGMSSESGNSVFYLMSRPTPTEYVRVYV